jgi:preprotein translocase subunit YajC
MQILIPMLLLGVLMWFMLIRPQRAMKRRREEMNAALSEGDEIVTIGGVYGRVHDVRDDTVDVEIAEDVIVRFDRRAVAGITKDVPAGPAQAEPAEELEEPEEPEAKDEHPSEPASVAGEETR